MQVHIHHLSTPFSEGPLIEDFSFSVEPGTWVELVGPSGSGKTTLLAALNDELAAEAADGISLELTVTPPVSGTTRRSRQDPAGQLVSTSVIDEFLLEPEYREATTETALQRALGTARRYGVTLLLPRATPTLSFGEARLVGLATLCQYPPKILLLDEPATGLDCDNQSRLQSLLQELCRTGTTIISTTTRPTGMTRTLDIPYRVPPRAAEPATELFPRTAAGAVHLRELRWPGQFHRLPLTQMLKPGSLLAITGPNGAGKTMLLTTILGQTAPISGTVTTTGRVWFVSQYPDRELTGIAAQDELGWAASEPGLSDPRGPADWLGLSDRLAIPSFLLSFGEKKRLTLAAGCVAKPDIMLLDEPFAGLDQRNQERVVRLLERFLQAGGIAVVATHEPDNLQNVTTDRLVLTVPYSRI